MPTKDLISACEEECAARLLIESGLAERLNMQQLLDIISKHPAIAKTIYNNPDIQQKLNHEELITLASLPFIARLVPSNSVALAKLNSEDLGLMGEAHLTIANTMFDTPKLVTRMHPCHLSKMGAGAAHLKIANTILNTPDLVEKLNGYDLSQMGEAHLTIANAILNAPKLVAKLSSYNLNKIGKAHLTIAHKILNTPELVAKLYYDDLREITRLVKLFQAITSCLTATNVVDLSAEHLGRSLATLKL